jgi:hypothetical protein
MRRIVRLQTVARRATLVVLLVALCSGQACLFSDPTVLPDTDNSPIPAGRYRGTISTSSSSYLSGFPVQQTPATDSEYAESFDAAGLPLTPDNTGMTVGYEWAGRVGEHDFAGTVTGIKAIDNGVRVEFDAVVSLVIEGETDKFFGNGSRSYTLVSPTEVAFSSEMYVESYVDVYVLSMRLRSNGTLVRQP